jgi:methyl-accepting chemotaxis protein
VLSAIFVKFAKVLPDQNALIKAIFTPVLSYQPADLGCTGCPGAVDDMQRILMGLSRIRIAYRLPAAFILIVALSLGVLGVFSYRSAKATLINSGEAELLDVAQSRGEALKHWSDEVETDLMMQARSPLLHNALRTFSAAWSVLGPDAQEKLYRLYVADNTFPAFQRLDLMDAGDGSVYSRAHLRFHDHFRSLMKRGAYRDVYVFDASGNMVYSVAKQDDFAKSTTNGAGGAFLQAVGRILSDADFQGPEFIDFFKYGSAGESSSFVVAPVRQEDGTTIGAIAYRMTIATLSENIGKSAGLGQTGQIFAIGPDGIARTEATGWHNDPLPEGSPLLGALTGVSAILHDPASLALSDLSDQMTAYAPANVFGGEWIVIASKNLNEILEPVSNFMSNTVTFGGLTLLVAAAIGLFIALGVSRPLHDIKQSIEQVSKEDYDQAVPHGNRRDEIGDIGRSLEELRMRLASASALTREMSFKSAALVSTSAALMITDENFNITYMNDAVKVMMQKQITEFRTVLKSFDPEKLIGVNIDLFHAKPDQIRRLIEDPSKMPFRTDIRVGNARIQIELSPVWGPEGEFAGLVVEWADVTEERRKTSVLSAIESGQIMAECDVDGRFVRVNNNFATMIGIPEARIIGRTFMDMVSLDAQTEHSGTILATIHAGTAVQGRFTVKCDAKGDAIVEGGFYPVIDRRNDTIGVTLIGSDVTAAQAQLRMAEERQQIMQAAQQSVVESLSVGMRDISNGDLTTRLNVPFAPEYEQLRTDFNDALENLTRAMRNISAETGAMHHETSEIVKAADEMSVRTERQAMTLQETASSLDELTTNITQTANGAAKANQVVSEARTRAEQSGSVVDEAENAMAQIAASSKEIVKVISVIDDISFQTNLLALNAGVEAARAGEAGRGFAVVATEVRALAQRCANAAAEINQLISVSGQHVSRGVELVGVTGETLKKIVNSISDISGYIAEIAEAGKEQSIGLAQVNTAVNQIDHVTQQNAAMFEETTSASHALAQRANSLSETIGHFQIGKTETMRPASPKKLRSARAPAVRGNLAMAQAPKSDPNDWEDF